MANSLQIGTSNVVAGLGTFSYTVPGTGGTAEVTDVTTVADVADSLNNTYFNLYSARDVTAYYVWYNTGAGVDPAIVGKTGIEVVITTGDTANAVATATRAALTAVADFVITGATNHAIVTNASVGATTDASDGLVPTGFTILVTTQGVTPVPFNSAFITMQIQSTIPRDPGSYLFSSQTSNQDSNLAIAIKQNATTVVSVGGVTPNPTPSQPSIGTGARLLCSGGDILSAVFSSTAAVDAQPNAVKSTVNLFLGA